VTSHEAPDGDALGSLLGSGLALRALGKDVVMFLGGRAPLPASTASSSSTAVASSASGPPTSASACSSPSTVRVQAA
jgi:hypothetical protein